MSVLAGDKIRAKHITWTFEDGDTLDEENAELTVRSIRNRPSVGEPFDEFFVTFMDMKPGPHTAVVQLHHIDEWEVVG